MVSRSNFWFSRWGSTLGFRCGCFRVGGQSVKLLVFSLGLNPELQAWYFSCGWSVGQAVVFLFGVQPWVSGLVLCVWAVNFNAEFKTGVSTQNASKLEFNSSFQPWVQPWIP
jgi:hypothetical protein